MELRDILIASELERGRTRQPDVFAERRAFNTIARRISYGREVIFQTLCEYAMELCDADSAGISVLRGSGKTEKFSWDTLAGQLAGYVGGRAPRHRSPCGVCLERSTPQLFAQPEKYFRWMAQAALPISEILVVPMFKAGRIPFGTLWIMVHDDRRSFDAEHVRIMTTLAQHASSTLDTSLPSADS
jgi:GAF domain-containing protein